MYIDCVLKSNLSWRFDFVLCIGMVFNKAWRRLHFKFLLNVNLLMCY